MRGIAELGKLCTRPAAEQTPRGFSATMWVALFHGLEGDRSKRTREEWRRLLRDTFERAALAQLAPLGSPVEERRATETRLLRVKFGASTSCCTCPLAEVADAEVAFDRLCLLWFALRDLTPDRGLVVLRAVSDLVTAAANA